MLKITIKETPSIKRFRKSAPQIFERGVQNGVRKIGFLLRDHAKQVSPIKRGHLRRSIRGSEGRLSYKVGTNVIYAKIQEFGGTITPKKGKFLAWKQDGSWIFAKRVRIKPYKGKGYFRPALKFAEKRANNLMQIQIQKALQ